MKKWQFISFLPVFFLMAFVGLFSLADEDTLLSLRERRTLAPPPVLTLGGVLSGAYQQDLEAHYVDQFPLRDQILSLCLQLNRLYYFDLGDNAVVLRRGSEGGGESFVSPPLQVAVSPSSASSPLPHAGGVSPSVPPGVSPSVPPGASPSVPPGASPSVPPTADAPPKESPAAQDAPTGPSEPPPLTYPNESESVQQGSIVLVGDRAVEIPYAAPKRITAYADALNRIQASLPNSRVISLLTPNGGEFYLPEKYHKGNYSQKDMIASAYAQMKNITTVDAYARLREKTNDYLFFRTDHHWTARGAYQAYLAYCDALGLAAVPLTSFETGRYEGFVGSMYGWTSQLPQSEALRKNPDYVEYFLPIRPVVGHRFTKSDMTDPVPTPLVNDKLGKGTSNKYLCFISGDNPLSLFKADTGTGKKCLVVKESYGNAFVPFLMSHYDEVYVVDPRLFGTKKNPNTFDLPAFAAEHHIDDVCVLNYPFKLTEKSWVDALDSML